MTEQVIQVAAIVTALATVALGIAAFLSWHVTRQLAEDNRRLRAMSVNPALISYLGIDRHTGFLVNLVIENIGQGPACDVEFMVHAEKTDFVNHGITIIEPESKRKVRTMLPAGERVELCLGSSFQLFDDSKGGQLNPFRVEVWYSSLSGKNVGPETFEIDISDFGGELAITPYGKQIVDAIQKLEKQFPTIVKEMRHFRAVLTDYFWMKDQ